MSRTTTIGTATIASSLVLATLISLSPASAQGNGQGFSPASQPPAPQEQAANPALAQFRDVLQRYGSISNHPRYGEVWTPSPGTVPAGWSPYPGCRWTYDRQQAAWSYQDPTEWGSIVHHHGRWAFDQQGGWMWIADATYGPGWVQWNTESGRVSWAALGPDIDGGQPTGGWQSQDAQSFNAGCRAPAPPAPVAHRAPVPAPVYGPAPAYAPAPAFGTRYVAGPPIYIPGPRPFPHGRPPHWHGPHKHGPFGPIIIVTTGKPGKGTGSDKGTGSGTGPGTGTGPATGTGAGSGPGKGSDPIMCIKAPCNIGPVGGPKGTMSNGGTLAGQQLVRPPFVRPAQLQRPFPMARPAIARPGGFQARPAMTARPVMQARAQFAPRSFGGGARFAGRR
ncbi:DUF6600 domain-containing protein [Enterovirga rhinocerotis]|uniref:YXWGXW repeat-containing protein n=1 Tax=Enterovirga rhinocerotis TaxID=1339210 RepID=A0A4R7C5F4_9HYPH|nr:DUF6600 domain-containing protein [Enterovirga rhinocerotis]TDR93122.1 hypothetical protein EV668_0376 [Enterovirga rhinocerotis]